jgi:hypothetical protein
LRAHDQKLAASSRSDAGSDLLAARTKQLRRSRTERRSLL